MRTDPLTDHAAQVLARMKIRKEEDRAEGAVMRASVAPVSRVTDYEQTTAGITTNMDGTITAVDGFRVNRPIDRHIFYPPFAIVRDYQEA
jgi:hypothetical protein